MLSVLFACTWRCSSLLCSSKLNVLWDQNKIQMKICLLYRPRCHVESISFLLVMLRWWANMEAGSVVRAMFEFLPSVSEELPLFTGDVIEVLSVVDEFWLLGIKDGVTGKVMRWFTLHGLSVILVLISFHSFCLQASFPALLWNRLQSQAPRQERIYMCASMTLTLWTYH